MISFTALLNRLNGVLLRLKKQDDKGFLFCRAEEIIAAIAIGSDSHAI